MSRRSLKLLRLAAVVPSACHVTVERAMIFVRDADGHGAGIDVAFPASFPESGSSGLRVRGAAVSALAGALDELTLTSTDPWPCRGSSELPPPHAEGHVRRRGGPPGLRRPRGPSS